MIRLALISITLALATAPARAQDYGETRALNAMRDSARAQERTARALERLERQDRDRAVREDRARRNAEQDSRSARRHD